MTAPRFAHLVQRPQPYKHGADVAHTIAEVRKRGPLTGPVVVVRVPPLDLKHPLHSARWSA